MASELENGLDSLQSIGFRIKRSLEDKANESAACVTEINAASWKNVIKLYLYLELLSIP